MAPVGASAAACSSTIASSSRVTFSASIGRFIQAVAPIGAAAPMKTVPSNRSSTMTRLTEAPWSASATMKSAWSGSLTSS